MLNDNLTAMAYDIYMHSFFSKKPNAKLKDILVEADKSSVQVGEAKQSTGEYPFFTSGSAILKWDTPFIDGRNCFLNTGGNADVKFYVAKPPIPRILGASLLIICQIICTCFWCQ